jgi:hypothetical protein
MSMASWWDTVFGGGAQEEAAAKNAAALQTYQGTALPALQQGYTTGTGAINSAIGAYTPLANLGTSYNQAGNLLLGAEGAGGPAGTAAAQAAFTNAPGYSGAIDAGLSAIGRLRAGQGMDNSGNTNLDAQTFGQNLQNQQYNSWLANLQQTAGMGLSATSGAAQGQAAGYGSLASLGYQYGSDQGNIANNVASGTIADNNMVAAGQAAGAKNLLGAGLSLASLAAAPFTGGLSLAGMGMGNAMGGSYGGTASDPLPGLSSSDYGEAPSNQGWRATYGLS